MRLSVVAACLSLCLVGFATANDAHASIRKDTNIPAEGLGPALNALARDRNFQIVYVTEEIANVRTGGATGSFTTEEALKRLLVGTGLSYRYLDDKTVTILPVGSATQNERAPPTTSESQDSDGSAAKEGKKNSSGDFRVAQLAQSASGSQTIDSQNWRSKKDEGLAEIIVTAQKREERLKDVPISIVAVSGDELKKRGIISLDDLQYAVPDLAIYNGGISRSFEIRGISNNVGPSALVGLYLDEADVTLGSADSFNSGLYDLERVEVLRGPQGTLYGEGSAGGTIRFITKKPDLGKFTFDSDVAALFTEGGSPSQRINAVANVPLIDNQLGLRIAATSDHEGGWINQPAADRKDINGQELTNVRIKGLWQPTPQFAVNAMAVIDRDSYGQGGTGEDENGNYTQAFNLTNTPRSERDDDLFNLTMTYDFPLAQVLSTSSYLKTINDQRNYSNSSPQLGPPGVVPEFQQYSPQLLTTNHILVEELRVTSANTKSWKWTAGAFFRHYRSEVGYPTFYFGSLEPPGTPLPDPLPAYNNKSLFNSWSIFGDTSYELTSRLTFGAGVRSFRDHQDYLDTYNPGETATFRSVDPRAYVQYKLAGQVNVYASVAKGFRSGGFNSFGQPSYGPESVRTYELGTKLSAMDDRVSFDTAVFYSKYTDFQTYGLSPVLGFPLTQNAGKVRIEGIEWDLTWRPTDQWNLHLSGDYLDSKFLEVNTLPDPVSGLPTSAFIVGDPLNLVPKYQFTLSGERDFHWNGKPGFIRLDYSQQGREVFRARETGPWYYDESDIIHLLNFKAGLQLNPSLGLAFYAQNLLNDRGFLNADNIDQSAPRSRPRTYGLEFTVAFD
jgi:iron complex outermembrane receptor protein